MEIFIGRIPPSLGIREINEIFAPYGATNVRMLDGKGCAFVNFESTFDGERAIAELNGHSVGGGQLNVKRASNKSSGGPPPSLPPPTPPAPRRENGVGSFGSPSVAAPASTPQPQLFIGRLPPNTSLHEIENAVLPYGAMNVKLLEGKNCAFAFFESWAQAEHCIAELNGAPLREGTEGLNVKLADLKGAPKGAQQEPKVFIGGIAPTVGQVEVQQACEQFGTVVDCKIFKKNDRSMPCAFVTFGSFTEAERCIQDLHESLNPLAAEGKALVAKMADMAKSQRTPPVPPLPTRERFDRVEPPRTFFNPAPIPVLPYPPVPSFEGRKGGYGGQPMHVPAPHPMHPVHPAPGPQGGGGLNDMPPAGGGMEDEKLFIGGLPASVSDEFLWGMMAPYGRVAEVKILRKSGAAPCGFVSFASMGEAEIALKALANCRFIVKYADSKGTKRPASVAFEDAFERRVR